MRYVKLIKFLNAKEIKMNKYFNYEVKNKITGDVIHLTVTKEEGEVYAVKYSHGAHQYIVEEIKAELELRSVA